MIRVAIYGRVSTRDKGQDVENQFIQLRASIKQHNALRSAGFNVEEWALVHEYRDECSGRTEKRPEFQQMLSDAASRKFDLLLFWSLDRLTREGVLETLQYLQRLSALSVCWKSHTEQYLDSTGPFRDAVIGILACIAQQESIRRSERALAAYDKKRATQDWDNVGRRKKVFPRGKAQEWARAGKSLSEIQAELAKLDYKVSRATLSRVCREARAAQPVAA